MFSSTSFVVVVCLLASLAFSGIVQPPSESDGIINSMTYVVDSKTDWSDGKLYDSNGALALTTKEDTKYLSILADKVVLVQVEIPKRDELCSNKLEVKDVTGVKFTLHWAEVPYGLYGWSYQRPGPKGKGPTFIYSPYSDSSTGINTVGGLVREKSDDPDKRRGEISDLGPPDSFPKNIFPRQDRAWSITVYGPGNATVTPRPLEMVELTYLLAQRNNHCEKYGY